MSEVLFFFFFSLFPSNISYKAEHHQWSVFTTKSEGAKAEFTKAL
jgi:hypothetical protein